MGLGSSAELQSNCLSLSTHCGWHMELLPLTIGATDQIPPLLNTRYQFDFFSALFSNLSVSSDG